MQCFSGTSQLQFHACGFQGRTGILEHVEFCKSVKNRVSRWAGREIVVDPGQMDWA